MSLVRSLAKRIGIDKAIAYSSGARVVQGLTGVASVFFITTFLTGVEQGFYYTFGSIVALQVFFELGLTGIMTQYVAHEVSHLSLDDQFQYQGDIYYKSRLASLVRFCAKWYSVLAALVFVFLMIVGFVYFNHYGSEHSNVSWQTPWVLICLGTAFKLFQSPFNSILMGLGKVKEMSKIGLVHIIINLYKTTLSEKVSYVKEIFPYQWKIALSWVSGYFIFQLFNPVLFASEGAVVAGQMGMTLTALNAIRAFSESWMNTKIPFYSQLIALKDFLKLDMLFNKTLKQMVCISTALLISFFLVVWLLNISELRLGENVLSDRFLSYGPLMLMMVSVLTQQFVSSWAMYLRCHKQEPFLFFSVCNGIACLLSTFFLGKKFGLYGVTIGYCFICLITLPWAYWIYKTYKKKWHKL